MQRVYKRRPRNFLIYPQFQLGLLGVQAAILLAVFAIVAVENRAAFAHMAKMGTDGGIPADSAYFDFVNDQAQVFFVHTGSPL